MARLSDVPEVLRRGGELGVARQVWKQQAEDNILTWASALAYSWLFAVFPFFIFLMTLVPLLPDRFKETANTEITRMIYTALPPETAAQIWTDFNNNIINQPSGGLLVRISGLVLAVWAASGGMAATMAAFDRCYELPLAGGRPFWKQRALALGMTIVIAILILLVLVLLPIGTVVKNWVVSAGHVAEGHSLLILFDVARWAIAMFLLVMVLMVLYHFGPGVRHHFRWITPGAVFAIVVWIVLGLAFRFYVTKFGNYSKTYGTLAGAAILLLVFYIDAVVLLFGAEINSEIDFEVLKVRRGTRDFRPAEEAKEPELAKADAPAAKEDAS